MLEYNNTISELNSVTKRYLALESYKSILVGTQSPGPLFQDLLKFSLESIDPGKDYFDMDENSPYSLSSIGKGLKTLLKWIKDLIVKAIGLGKNFIVKFTGTTALISATRALNNRRLNKLGNKSIIAPLRLTAIDKVSINGEFKGFDLKTLNQLKDITKFYVEDYPKFITNFSRTFARQSINALETNNNITDKDVDSIFAEVYNDKLILPTGSKEQKGDNISYHVSPTLPGNRAFIFPNLKDVSKAVQELNVEVENKVKLGIGLEFKTLDLEVPDDHEKQFNIPTTSELKRLNDKIAEIINLSSSNKKMVKDFDNLQIVLRDAIQQISELENINDNVKSHAIKLLTAIVDLVISPSNNYLRWLAVTLNVYATLISKCIDIYEEN